MANLSDYLRNLDVCGLLQIQDLRGDVRNSQRDNSHRLDNIDTRLGQLINLLQRQLLDEAQDDWGNCGESFDDAEDDRYVEEIDYESPTPLRVVDTEVIIRQRKGAISIELQATSDNCYESANFARKVAMVEHLKGMRLLWWLLRKNPPISSQGLSLTPAGSLSRSLSAEYFLDRKLWSTDVFGMGAIWSLDVSTPYANNITAS